jgi:hypothetical protein
MTKWSSVFYALASLLELFSNHLSLSEPILKISNFLELARRSSSFFPISNQSYIREGTGYW